MIKKLFLLVLLAAAIAGGAVFYGLQQVNQYLGQPMALDSAEIITIKSGSSFQSVLRQLEEKEWIKPSDYSRFVRRVRPELVKLKAGTFQLQPDMTLAQALAFLIDGKEHQFAITFVEGSRFSEWREILNSAQFLTHDTKALSEAEIAKKLGLDKEKLEGLFLAETYHYTAGTSDLEILKRSNDKLTKVLESSWEARQDKLPLKSAYDALILASIIEKETAVESERTTVSSVFNNRLKRGMRLQTDPTVIYGMGDKYKGNIRKKDLQTPTAYNTYVIKGLPPTPIAMAGEASIKAALNPESTKYLYFVASGKGGHVFSKTLTEHNRAVRAYLKQLRKKK
ncbi:endolytic transglycosylase MltG [Vibrio sp. JC009]|uniref:endolytic transglycosylase MltG n=1 Tax=Vibrio sp. JC009 TaxID=2912314 RepID=UPI0023B1F894|nr:endolytic transglycosylase MltG [Vibrio sp. JC009]WED22678.1 endolytic transglycosylase MltG [Vibrio sp. JC009]